MKILWKPLLVGFCIAILVNTLSGFTFVNWQWWIAVICLSILYLSAHDSH